MPSATTTRLWNRPQVSRSSRAGMAVSIKAEADRVRASAETPPSALAALSCMRKERRGNQGVPTCQALRLVSWPNREVEDRVGVGLRLEREVPPFLRVVLEAMRLHGLDQEGAVFSLLLGKPRNDGVGLKVEAVEARAHGETAVRCPSSLRRRAGPRLAVLVWRR